MATNEGDAPRVMEDFTAQWTEASKEASSKWQSMHREWATSYRDFLDKHIADESKQDAGQQWTQGILQFLEDSMARAREARARYLESQRSMIDGYLKLLDDMDPTPGE